MGLAQHGSARDDEVREVEAVEQWAGEEVEARAEALERVRLVRVGGRGSGRVRVRVRVRVAVGVRVRLGRVRVRVGVRVRLSVERVRLGRLPQPLLPRERGVEGLVA